MKIAVTNSRTTQTLVLIMEDRQRNKMVNEAKKLLSSRKVEKRKEGKNLILRLITRFI